MVLSLRYYSRVYSLPPFYKEVLEQFVSKSCPEEFAQFSSSLAQFDLYDDLENCKQEWASFMMNSRISPKMTMFYMGCLFFLAQSLNLLDAKPSVADYREEGVGNGVIKQVQQFFPKSALILFFWSGTLSNFFSSQGDIIGITYVSLSLIFLINGSFNKRSSRRKGLLFLEAINFFFLILLVTYQTPFFPCPVQDDSRRFISTAECNFDISNKQQNIFEDISRDLQNNLIPFFLGTVGVIKLNQENFFSISKEMLMAVFFFCALLVHQTDLRENQTKSEALDDFLSEKRKLTNALKYVFRFFLYKYWKYQKYKQKRELFMSKNKVIDQRIQQWENFMNDESKNIQQKNLLQNSFSN